jgi:isocitrate dehydrogenase
MSEASTISLSADGRLTVPDQPIIPFIEGGGIGPDIWRGRKKSAAPPMRKWPSQVCNLSL